jgi:hypothetical protein
MGDRDLVFTMFGEECSYIYIYKNDVDSAMFTTLFVVSSVSTSTRGLESSLDAALGSDGSVCRVGFISDCCGEDGRACEVIVFERGLGVDN